MTVSWDDIPLGTKPDTVLAKELGVSEVAVGKQRRKRGIPVYGSTDRMGRVQGQHAGINWDEQPLGEVTDKELAHQLGVDPSSVRSARKVREPIHEHKCPVCSAVSECKKRFCKVDEDDFGGYLTCNDCLESLKKEKVGTPVFFTGRPGFKVGD